MEIRPDQISLKCEICEKEFKKSNSLNYHLNITHKLEKEHQCNICQKIFHLKNQLTTHVKGVHGNKQTMCLMWKIFSSSPELEETH